VPPDYPALLGHLDIWQDAAHSMHPGVIPCRAGCSACCHGPFDISVADALLVRDAVTRLPTESGDEVRRRAGAQIERMGQLSPGFAAPWDVAALGDAIFDDLVNALEDDPCPALDDEGRCRIYQHRPMICRLMGLGLLTPAGPVLENSCPIQDDFPEYAALPPQPFDLNAWEASEAVLKERAAVILFGDAPSAGYETTVAGAALLERRTPRADASGERVER
jgi:Fe-S-cluster containining protein